MTKRFTLFAAFLVCWSLSAHAATLKPDVTVAGDTLTLADIFDGVETGGERVITAAPAPGRTMVLDARTLQGLARANRVEWQAENNVVHCTVHRASQKFDSVAIADAVQSALSDNDRPALGRVTAKLDNTQTELHAPVGMSAALAITDFSVDPTTQRFGAMAKLTGNEGQTIAQTPISGRLQTLINVPVLTRALRKGDVISASDLDWKEIEQTAGSEHFLLNAEELIGKTPRQAVRASVPLRGFDLVQPVVVNRGSQVTMLFENGRLQISTQGKAMSDAAVGETVRVVNLMSSRTVEGTVEAPGLVRIGSKPTSTATQMAAAPQPITPQPTTMQ